MEIAILSLLLSVSLLSLVRAASSNETSFSGKACARDKDCGGDSRAYCDGKIGHCACSKVGPADLWILPLDNNLIKCVSGKRIGDACSQDTECHRSSGPTSNLHSRCANGHCACKDGHRLAKAACVPNESNTVTPDVPLTTNTHMLPIMIVMGIMFIGMCVALNLFSRARFQNTRGVFNTPHSLKTGEGGKKRTRRTSRGGSSQRGQAPDGEEGSPSDSVHSNNVEQEVAGATVAAPSGKKHASGPGNRETTVLISEGGAVE